VVITSVSWFFDFENLCFQVFKTYGIKELIVSIFWEFSKSWSLQFRFFDTFRINFFWLWVCEKLKKLLVLMKELAV
jgi:hypothetical protein